MARSGNAVRNDEIEREAVRGNGAMARALDEAVAAGAAGEVPVGGVLVDGAGDIIAAAGNRVERDHDPTAHAEMLVLREGAARLGAKRLAGCDLYVTLEPCPMCAGAIVQARIARVVYGAADPKAGACDSLYRLADDPRLNHRAEVRGGLLAVECGALLSQFFQTRRPKREVITQL